MNSKRGQVTIFLIVGIVILLVSILILYLTQDVTERDIESEKDLSGDLVLTKSALISYVESCIEDVTSSSLYLLSMQGGFIYNTIDTEFLAMENGLIQYGLFNGEKIISKDRMEKDLSEFVNKNLPSCLNDFSSFKNAGIDVVYEGVESKVGINQQFITVIVDLSMKSYLPEDEIISFSPFKIKLESKLANILDTTNEIIEIYEGGMDLNKFSLLNYSPILFPYDFHTTIFSLHDEESEEPLTFMFAVRDDGYINHLPELEFISDKTLRAGDQLELVLEASDRNNDVLIFSSDSKLFPVSEEGNLKINVPQKGTYQVTFTVDDGRGGSDKQKVKFVILEQRDEGAIIYPNDDLSYMEEALQIEE